MIFCKTGGGGGSSSIWGYLTAGVVAANVVANIVNNANENNDNNNNNDNQDNTNNNNQVKDILIDAFRNLTISIFITISNSSCFVKTKSSWRNSYFQLPAYDTKLVYCRILATVPTQTWTWTWSFQAERSPIIKVRAKI